MNMRGRHAEMIDPNSFKVNATSAQGLTNKNRLDFSPMTAVPGGYKGYYNFESYWQSGKVYEDIDIETTKKWWKENKLPKRRYPKSKGKRVLYAIFDGNTERMDYITSRKQVYVPEYYNMIRNREMTKYWKKMVKEGNCVTIYDFDGPRTPDGQPTCVEVNLEMLIEKINDPTFPFGHGYVVAATIAGIKPDEYI
jgi:hypothetical protein